VQPTTTKNGFTRQCVGKEKKRKKEKQEKITGGKFCFSFSLSKAGQTYIDY